MHTPIMAQNIQNSQIEDTNNNQNRSQQRIDGDMSYANFVALMQSEKIRKVQDDKNSRQMQNDYFVLGIGSGSGGEKDVQSMRGRSSFGVSQRQSSHDVKRTSKIAQEIQYDIKALSNSKKRKLSHKSQKSDQMKVQFDEEQDDVIGFLTSQVLDNVLENEGIFHNDAEDNDSCEAASFDIKEGKIVRVAPLKRAIDHEHQKNLVKKNYLTNFLNNYDKVLQKRELEQEIDFNTGLPKICSKQSKVTESDNKSNVFDQAQHEEELFEMSQLRNVAVHANYNQNQVQDFNDQINLNAQTYLLTLIKINVAEQYQKAKTLTDQKQKEGDQKEGEQNKAWIVDNPYYKTTPMNQDISSTNRPSLKTPIKTNKFKHRDLDGSMDKKPRLGQRMQFGGGSRFQHLNLAMSPVKQTSLIKQSVKRQLASTSQASQALNFDDANLHGFKRPLNIIIDEQEEEEDYENDQFQERVNMDANRRKNGVIVQEAKQVLGRKIAVKRGSFQLQSRSQLQEFDEFSGTLCDEIAVGQEDAFVQTVRDSSWVSDKEESMSNNSSTRSRKIVRKKRTKIDLDANIYGISNKYRQVDIDDLEERASSNSVKRSIQPQKKWTDQKQVKITIVESPVVTMSSDKDKGLDIGFGEQIEIENAAQFKSQSNLFQKKQVSVLADQNKLYLTNCKTIEKLNNDLSYIQRIKERFRTSKIMCIKYNYSLDQEVQEFCAFKGYLQLSDDGLKLNIYNKKNIRKAQYSTDPDYKKIKQKREDFTKTLVRDKKTKILLEENFKEGVDYICKKSNSSTALDKIENILYGGLSSRFWLFRKHMIQHNKKSLRDDNLPFYSWQCITLQLKHREVDLVIPNQQDMNDFLLLLIDSMNTIDGFKDSADPIKMAIHQDKYKRELRRQTKLTKRQDMKKIKFLDKQLIWTETELTPEEHHKIKMTTLMKYKIMRVRAKISFMAFKNSKTVPEMIFDEIMKSYLQVAKLKEEELGDLSDQFELFRMNDHAFQTMITDGMGNIFNRIMQLNVQELKQQDLVSYVKLKFQQAVDILENHNDDITEKVRDKKSMRWKQVRIDELKNLQLAMKNATNLNKNRSSDIFLQMEKQGNSQTLLAHVNYRDLIKYKQSKYNITKAYQRLKIVINLKAVSGIMMLKALINKIKYAKQIFVLEIEQNKEAYIPNELSSDNLPSSYWFYDACLQQAQDLIVADKKEFATFKNQYRLNFYQRNDVKKHVMIRLGLIDDPNKQKIILKHQMINEIEDKIIVDHNILPTSMSLQRSRYVTIDEDVNRLQDHYKIQGRRLQQEMDKQINIRGCQNHVRLPQEMRAEAQMLILRYCPDQEITRKRKQLLDAKSTFLNKIVFLKILGKKLQLMQKVDNHIEENIDTIYQDYVKFHPRRMRANKTVYEVIMADELEKEDQFQAKKKLHTKLMDNIEHWLQVKANQLRSKNVAEIRRKAGPHIQFHAKNHFIETDLEKHIKWFSKVRGFDIQTALLGEFNQVRKTKKEKMDQKLIQRLHQNQGDANTEDADLDAQLAMLMQIQDRDQQEALQQQMKQTLNQYNQKTIDILRNQIKDDEERIKMQTRDLNVQRAKQRKQLGVMNMDAKGENDNNVQIAGSSEMMMQENNRIL